MAFEDAAPDQHRERARRPPAGFGRVDRQHARAEADVARPRAGVRVQHEAELLGERPQRLVPRVVVRGPVEPAGRDEDAAVPELLRFAHQREHRVHVGDDRRDHRDADAAMRVLARRSRRASGCARGSRRPPRSTLSAAPASPVPNGDAAMRPVPSTSASGNSTSATTPSSSSIALRAAESNAAVSPPSPPVSSSHSSLERRTVVCGPSPRAARPSSAGARRTARGTRGRGSRGRLGRRSGVAVGGDDDVPVHDVPPEVLFESSSEYAGSGK